MLPFYLTLVFGLLRIAEVGVALLIANYAASAIARQVAQGTGDDDFYKDRFAKLLLPGMINPVVKVDKNGAGMLRDVTVLACARMDANLLLGRLEKKAFPKTAPDPAGTECLDTGPGWRGPFRYFRAGPYYLIVKGKATARLNYQLP